MNTEELQTKLQEAEAEIKRLRKLGRCKREPNALSIGGIIQVKRESMGLGLNEVAKIAGVTASTWSRVERFSDTCNPTISILDKMCQAISTPMHQIIEEWETKKL